MKQVLQPSDAETYMKNLTPEQKVMWARIATKEMQRLIKQFGYLPRLAMQLGTRKASKEMEQRVKRGDA